MLMNIIRLNYLRIKKYFKDFKYNENILILQNKALQPPEKSPEGRNSFFMINLCSIWLSFCIQTY